MVSRESMKDLLTVMFNGWRIRNDSYDPDRAGDYGVSQEAAMIEAAGGDEIVGLLISLFDHWSNDIVALAEFLGLKVSFSEDGKIVTITEIEPKQPEREEDGSTD